MTPPWPFDDDRFRDQEDAAQLLLQVALRLLGEARLRGDFGGRSELRRRAAELTAEFTGGAPSPDPRHATVEVDLLRPDRVSLAAYFEEDAATTWSLMLDGTLYDGGTTGSIRAARVDPRKLSDEERADLELRQAEWRARIERARRFTATRFVRAIAAPPQPGAERRVLAVVLYEDGFYLDYTYDKERPTFDPEMAAERFFADAGDERPEITIADDVGTEYFESGGAGWGGGMRVSHSSFGFAPAPPPDATLLRIDLGGATVELDLVP